MTTTQSGTRTNNVAPTRLVLHVGLPKTGSSALQHWLHVNQSLLRLAGVWFPGGDYLSGGRHQFMVRDLRICGLGRLSRLLGEARTPTVLLSAEGLTNHLQDFSEPALAEFRELTNGLVVEIVLVRRQSEAWVRSYHRQCVINPRNGASELWGTGMTREQLAGHPRVMSLLNRAGLESTLATAFGAERVLALEYEEDWFASFAAFLGLDPRACGPLPSLNETVPDWAIEMLRALNERTTPENRRNWWKRRLAEFLDSNHMELRAAPDPAVDVQLLRSDLEVLRLASQRAMDGKPMAATFVGSMASRLAGL